MAMMTQGSGTIIPFSGKPEKELVPTDMLLDGTRDLGEATYAWNIETDVMNWGMEATHIFGVREMAALSSGTAFATLIDLASPHSRHSEVFESERRDQGTGVSFSTRYLVNPAPGLRFWIEDTGRWFANEQGRPRLVHGVCRRVLAPTSEEIALVTKRHFDPTTGALTRADFCNALGDAIVTNAKDSRGLVLMMVAVDDLAQLNKTYGYPVGDEIIAAIVRRLRGLIRRRDILGRYATNKIGIVLAPSLAEHMDFVANRLASAIRGVPIDTSAGPIPASVHVGGVAIPRDARTAIEALHACEEALSDVMDRTDQAFLAFSSDPATRAKRSSNRESTDTVLTALNDRRIELAFQPIVHSGSGELAMHEALVRMTTPAGELMGAGTIVPVAERLGFLHLIDHRVMELALETLRSRRDIQLTVNVGVETALHPDWMAAFRAHLAIDASVARRLVVEITETSLIEDVQGAQRLIEAIKDCGARVAIDDFGAGHTSFRNMRLLPIDILKIDGTFIKNLARSEDDRFFVQTLLQLARHLRIETVAEWVQDEETANLLTSWRVEYLQGDFVGVATQHLPEPQSSVRAIA
ncbi:MAG: EAL domain-containing protein [Methylobacterium sp.]|jgi:diguanylate cyclase (GGDEF)-like protein|nr:EAL domain-containing protein [Methylobacterium sp.]MCA3598868.1 EAL domain-containing protein [Methylobacterium sp.]MCA3599518.1 EAL domain-containing protein [Methylobacterium sp.]MCA3602936.1 EAL domain-containing protein [Methylobacterium sp.]MCA3606980.1 EAL domain-containing protein [Methylobacterium sp.]